ncbi:hypothetical protein AX15_004077 [Amanita polypyramis BW_CC]|nr:hypothetical protein AX15_004077 [Amanita polypyramis BW_CC]
MRMLGNSIEGFTPSKRKLVYSSCIWSIASYGSVLWYRKNAKGVKQKANKLDKVKNTAMHWISGAFSTSPISALEVITAIPPIKTQLNITTMKYALRINKLSAIHPCHRLARTFQFQSLQNFRINVKPSAYEKFSTFTLCRDPSNTTDERFVYDHYEQIKGLCVMDLYGVKIHFCNFDHLKKDSDLFQQWFYAYQSWLNTIRNERNHLIIATDGSFTGHYGSASCTWVNQELIFDDKQQVSSHSSFDSELQAIDLAFKQLPNYPYTRPTLLIDNEPAARTIWNTDFHNLQATSLSAMTNFRKWITSVDISQVLVNVSWCPAHMDIDENEVVDQLASEVIFDDDIPTATTLQSQITETKRVEYDAWDSKTRKHNALGHDYLRLKFKGRRVGPALGSRKNAFIMASNDNIRTLPRLTRIATNHAPTGEYRRRSSPSEPINCQFDGEFHTRSHILTKCQCYDKRFQRLDLLCRRKDGLEKLGIFLERNTTAVTEGDAPKGIG